MSIAAYPLQWPDGWRRIGAAYRVRSHFTHNKERLSVMRGLERTLAELNRMGVGREDTVVSTNLRTRLDGLPRSDQAEPSDPGVAVYWQEPGGARRVMAIDLYDRVADNLAAIAATLDAMRAIERHGGAAILERAFTGFAALPAPAATRPWRDVLGVGTLASATEIRDAFRAKRSQAHPQNGGTTAEFDEVQRAYDQAVAEGRA